MIDENGYVYIEGKFSRYLETLTPLFNRHWKFIAEAGAYDDLNKDYKLDADTYKFLEESGQLITTGVFDKDDNLVGYCSCVKSVSLHRAGESNVLMDGIYVEPEHRGKVGIRLLKFTMNLLRDKYNTVTFQAASNKAYNLGVIYKRLGFSETDTIFVKRMK